MSVDEVLFALAVDADGGVGGSDGLALELAKQSLKKGKFFVTANKALIAKHGINILKISNRYNSKFSFEAAVGGGVPIIRILQNSMIVGNTKNIYGILSNGLRPMPPAPPPLPTLLEQRWHELCFEVS